MNVLLIGGTGLISTAVTQQLIGRGDRVTLFNRGVSPVRFEGDVTLIAGDRADHAAFEARVRAAGPWDCAIDMICSDAGNAAALRRACAGITAHVVFCSSTNAYPKPADAYPVRPDHRLSASFANGIAKIECETVHREAEASGDYAVTVIRPGHTYGETGSVLHSLGNGTSYLDRLRHGKPIVVHGDGQGLWSALHAEDVARVFVAAAGNPAAFGRSYNAAGEEWMTWDQYHAAVAAAMDVALPPVRHVPTEVLLQLAPTRAAQSARSLQYPGVYDMADARADLGFRQRIPITAGMARVIGWIEANGGFDSWQSDPEHDRIVKAWDRIRESATR